MEKLKPMSKTFTLTRRDSRSPFKEPNYRLCKEGKFYYFSSIGGVAFFIAELIKPRSKDDLVTVTVESTNLKQRGSRPRERSLLPLEQESQGEDGSKERKR